MCMCYLWNLTFANISLTFTSTIVPKYLACSEARTFEALRSETVVS